METIDGQTAFLLMDVQPSILHRLNSSDEYIGRVRTALQAAHDRRITVIFVVVGFRDGMPEINPDNKNFARMRSQPITAFVNPEPAIEPTAGDIVVVKRRVSAFSGSDLEIVLRAQGIRHLVLGGIATSGVVLSTVRRAADMDYRLTVLSDLCVDRDEEVHRVLIERVFPRQAEVLSSKDWIDRL